VLKYDDLNQTVMVKKGDSLLNFFYQIAFYMLETYYVVLMTIDTIRNENQKLRLDKIVETIHDTLKELHSI